MKFTLALTSAILAASASATAIQRRSTGPVTDDPTNGGVPDTTFVTNGGTPDVFSTSVIPTITNGGVPDTTAPTVTVQPPTGTVIVDPFPTDSVCANAAAQKGTYQGRVNDPVCGVLVDDCTAQVADGNTNLWGIESCVAAATCDGTHNLLQLAKCVNPTVDETIGEPSDLSSLDYNIYASIVGDCAWAQGGCPITRQNYIDFIYRHLGEINTPIWPDVNVVINNWWWPIRSWTATGDSIPYVNFNDWLHWSTS